MTEWWGFGFEDNLSDTLKEEDKVDYLKIYNDLLKLSKSETLCALMSEYFKLKRFNYLCNFINLSYGIAFNKYIPSLDSHLEKLVLINQIYESLKSYSISNFKYLSSPSYNDIVNFYQKYRSNIL